MKQEQTKYTAANGKQVILWKAKKGAMILPEGQLYSEVLLNGSEESVAVTTIAFGLELIGWEAA